MKGRKKERKVGRKKERMKERKKERKVGRKEERKKEWKKERKKGFTSKYVGTSLEMIRDMTAWKY